MMRLRCPVESRCLTLATGSIGAGSDDLYACGLGLASQQRAQSRRYAVTEDLSSAGVVASGQRRRCSRSRVRPGRSRVRRAKSGPGSLAAFLGGAVIGRWSTSGNPRPEPCRRGWHHGRRCWRDGRACWRTWTPGLPQGRTCVPFTRWVEDLQGDRLLGCSHSGRPARGTEALGAASGHCRFASSAPFCGVRRS
jgi:hypothetical protein